MVAFIGQRALQGIVVMLIVAFAAFVMSDYVGDPVANMVAQEASGAERAQLRDALGLNDPFAVRFARFVSNATAGDFGMSYHLRRPVAELIAERMPATLELVGLSALLAVAIGLPLGVYTGIFVRSRSSRLILAVSLFGVSLPTFVIGMLLIYIFSVSLGLLPAFGRGEVVHIGWWSTGLLTLSGCKSIILPALTLAALQVAAILRLVRSEMIEVLRSDYIRCARARGLSNRAVYFGHALSNTLIPVLTIIGLNIGSLIAFSTITETVFQWPGMGSLFIEAIRFADIPVMAAYLVFVAMLFVVCNLVVDILYCIVDPRLRMAGRGTAMR